MDDLFLRISDDYDRYKKGFIDAAIVFKNAVRTMFSRQGIVAGLVTPFIIDHYKLQDHLLNCDYKCREIFDIPDILRLKVVASDPADISKISGALDNEFRIVSAKEKGDGGVSKVVEFGSGEKSADEKVEFKKLYITVDIRKNEEPGVLGEDPIQDFDTLKTLGNKIGIVKYIDAAICDETDSVLCESFVYMYEKERLNFLGIVTILELGDMLELYRDRIISFSKALLEATPIRSLVKGISVMYLYYLLLAETADKNKIVDFMNLGLSPKVQSSQREEMERFADRLMAIRMKI